MKKIEKYTYKHHTEYRVGPLLHNDDGPAFIYHNLAGIYYYKHGKRHRDNGPAIIYNGVKSYWLDDCKIEEDVFRVVQFFKGIDVIE